MDGGDGRGQASNGIFGSTSCGAGKRRGAFWRYMPKNAQKAAFWRVLRSARARYAPGA